MQSLLVIYFIFLIFYQTNACPFNGCQATYQYPGGINCICGNDLNPFSYVKNPLFQPNFSYTLDIFNSVNIPDDSFNGLEIDELYMKYSSNIQKISKNSFRGIKKLNFLAIHNLDNLSLIESGAFTPLENSTYSIEVVNTKLTNISEINNLKQVSYITLSFNPFEVLVLKNLNSLSKLFLNENELKAINLSFLPFLRELQILNNRLALFNSINFTELPSLSNLDLTGNRFTELINPSFLYNLPQFINLDISKNLLKYVDISNIENLLSLTASNNNISVLKLKNLSNLNGIILSNNQLSNVVLDNLTSLNYLDVSKNNLTTLSIFTLKNTFRNTEYTVIDLSFNNLTDISGLSAIKNLKYILASNNRINSFNYETFLKSFLNLYKIDLSYNNLDGFFVLSTNPSLSIGTLDISNNKISTLILSNLTNIEQIFFKVIL